MLCSEDRFSCINNTDKVTSSEKVEGDAAYNTNLAVLPLTAHAIAYGRGIYFLVLQCDMIFCARWSQGLQKRELQKQELLRDMLQKTRVSLHS